MTVIASNGVQQIRCKLKLTFDFCERHSKSAILTTILSTIFERLFSKMAKRQQTLLTIWSKEGKEDSVKRRKEDSDTAKGLGSVKDLTDDFRFSILS